MGLLIWCTSLQIINLDSQAETQLCSGSIILLLAQTVRSFRWQVFMSNLTAKIKQCIWSGVCPSQHFSLSFLQNHYFVSIILLLLGYDLLKIIPLNVNWAPVNNFTHFCEQIISYQSLQVRIQKCQPIGGFNWGLEARRPLTYQINRCRRARKNWGSFFIKKNL